MSNLHEAATAGTLWSFADAVAVRTLHFATGIVLARLLLPEQFGLIGMLAIFMALSQTLLGSGLSTALIQKEAGVTSAEASSVFYYHVTVGAALTGVLYLSAPLVAQFYHQPALTPIMRVMALVTAVRSLGLVHTALLTRNVDFKTQTKVNLIAATGSGLVAVTMAYRGLGVWSLVVLQLSETVLGVVFLWSLSRWRPRAVFSFHALRQLFAFAYKMLAGVLLDQLFTNLYFVVIGRLFNATALGFYSRAARLVDLPALTITTVVSRVTFPVFSAVQTRDDHLTELLRRALTAVFFVTAPLMIGFAVVAEPLVRVLLTERWLPSVPYLQLLCVVGLLLPMQVLNLNILMAKGRSDLFLRLEVLKRALEVIAILITWRYGILALIWGQVVLSCVSYIVDSYYTGKFLRYGR
jgi:O-antigen/teichoic acid export membrane protein